MLFGSTNQLGDDKDAVRGRIGRPAGDEREPAVGRRRHVGGGLRTFVVGGADNRDRVRDLDDAIGEDVAVLRGKIDGLVNGNVAQRDGGEERSTAPGGRRLPYCLLRLRRRW